MSAPEAGPVPPSESLGAACLVSAARHCCQRLTLDLGTLQTRLKPREADWRQLRASHGSFQEACGRCWYMDGLAGD